MIMGLMGFPTEDDVAQALGVDAETQERWARYRELNAKRRPSTLRGLADKTVRQGVDLAKLGIETTMTGDSAGRASSQENRRYASYPRRRVTTETEYTITDDGPDY